MDDALNLLVDALGSAPVGASVAATHDGLDRPVLGMYAIAGRRDTVHVELGRASELDSGLTAKQLHEHATAIRRLVAPSPDHKVRVTVGPGPLSGPSTSPRLSTISLTFTRTAGTTVRAYRLVTIDPLES